MHLDALGRLTESLQPLRAGLEMDVQRKAWGNAGISAGNLSEAEILLGRLRDAVEDSRQSIIYADQSGDAFQRMGQRTTAADALHQCGQRTEAGTLFAEAERMQKESRPEFDLLYSLRGFQYCDWLLAPASALPGRRSSETQGSGPGRTRRARSSAQIRADVARRTRTMKGRGTTAPQLAFSTSPSIT